MYTKSNEATKVFGEATAGEDAGTKPGSYRWKDSVQTEEQASPGQVSSQDWDSRSLRLED